MFTLDYAYLRTSAGSKKAPGIEKLFFSHKITYLENKISLIIEFLITLSSLFRAILRSVRDYGPIFTVMFNRARGPTTPYII